MPLVLQSYVIQEGWWTSLALQGAPLLIGWIAGRSETSLQLGPTRDDVRTLEDLLLGRSLTDKPLFS